MDYTEVRFVLSDPEDFRKDLLIAALGEAGYEAFEESDTGFKAYIRSPAFSASALKAVVGEEGDGLSCRYEVHTVPYQNWNEIWERNFQPVSIGPACRVRASFHPADPAFPYEIVIDPKNAFGTGHHETTWLMAACLLRMHPAGKTVLDMGCGTGILGILACKLGAGRVIAADIDPVCTESARENAEINGVGLAGVYTGDIELVKEQNLDIILANINKNIILVHLPVYSEKLRPGGTLLVSGFYADPDMGEIKRAALENGLSFADLEVKNNWAAARFEKL